MPDSYAARAKKMPEEPAIIVLSRSKNAAARGSPSTEGRPSPPAVLTLSSPTCAFIVGSAQTFRITASPCPPPEQIAAQP